MFSEHSTPRNHTDMPLATFLFTSSITVCYPSSFSYEPCFCTSGGLKSSGHCTERKQEVDVEVWGLWGLEIKTSNSRGEISPTASS